MRLSLQVQYAVCGVFDLAYNGHGQPVQVRVVGERQAIPARYLEQIFQRLRRARLVEAKRGPGGGYSLARPPAEITLRDVVEAVEGPLDANLGEGPPVREGGDRSFRPHFLWADLSERLRGLLGEITLEQLCAEALRASVRRAEPESGMWFI